MGKNKQTIKFNVCFAFIKMSENGNSTVAGAETAAKKPRLENETIEEKDFDEETQKALEEIDATQNEIDTLNERKDLNYFLLLQLQVAT